MDDIYPGAHQEVLRKIGDCIHSGTMTQERLDNEFNLPCCEYPPEYVFETLKLQRKPLME